MGILESLWAKIPDRLKPPLRIGLGCLRLLGRNRLKEFKIKRRQEQLLAENYSASAKKLIVFLTPGRDIVNGGILSISSIYEETIKVRHIHGAEVIMCTIPGDPPLLRYTRFNNQNYIYRFSQVLSYFQNLQNLMIHIPEYCVGQFLKHISNEDYSKLHRVEEIHINIMLQNINLLPPIENIRELGKLGKLTCTTSHKRYSTLETREKMGCPLHRLGAYGNAGQYDRRKYTEKEDLMIVSPDIHPRKSEVLRLIAKEFPQLRIHIIRHLTYEEYKELVARARWGLTFGEGLDGYFAETIFSGGVGFSVYNTAFFTDDFRALWTVYDDYDMLIERICSDIKNLDNETEYTSYQDEQYELCRKHSSYDEYVNNLKSFYRGEYTYK